MTILCPQLSSCTAQSESFEGILINLSFIHLTLPSLSSRTASLGISFSWGSITRESPRHAGSLGAILMESQLPPQPWCRLCVLQHCLCPVPASSGRGCCARQWLPRFRKQCGCGMFSKKDLKYVFRLFVPPFFVVIYINRFFPSRMAGKIRLGGKFVPHFLSLFLSTQPFRPAQVTELLSIRTARWTPRFGNCLHPLSLDAPAGWPIPA